MERGYKRSVTHDIDFPFSGIRKSTLRIRPEEILFGSTLPFGAVPCLFSPSPRFIHMSEIYRIIRGFEYLARTAVSKQIARRAPICLPFHGKNVMALFFSPINRYPSDIPDCIRLLNMFLNVTQPCGWPQHQELFSGFGIVDAAIRSRIRKQEARSKKQEARSKNQEPRTKIPNALPILVSR